MVTFRDPGLSIHPQGPLTGPGAGLGEGNPIIGAGAQAGPFPLLSARAQPPLTGPGALGPRIISTGTPDPTTTASTGGGGGYGDTGLPTLDALLARQKELGKGGAEMGEMISPWQGASYALQQGLEGFQQGKNDRDILAQEMQREQILGSLDESGMPTMDQISDMSAVDPELAAKLYDTMMTIKMKREELAAKEKTEGGPKITDESGLRQDYIGDLSYKNWQSAAPMWNSMQDAVSRDTPQSDLNMVIAMAKLFDPTSVVRTEEGEMVRETGGLPSGLYGKFLYLTGQKGSRLAPEVRAGMMQEAYSRMQGYHTELQKHHDWISQTAARYGMDPRNITGGLPELMPWAAPEEKPPELVED